MHMFEVKVSQSFSILLFPAADSGYSNTTTNTLGSMKDFPHSWPCGAHQLRNITCQRPTGIVCSLLPLFLQGRHLPRKVPQRARHGPRGRRRAAERSARRSVRQEHGRKAWSRWIREPEKESRKEIGSNAVGRSQSMGKDIRFCVLVHFFCSQ